MLADYRVETYNIISQEYNLDVAFTNGDRTNSHCNFNKVKLSSIKIGPLYYIKNLYKLCNKYDVVIMMADLHYPQYCLMPFLKRKYKVLSWGIGFRVSYNHPYLTNRKHVFLDNLLKKVLVKCDANILYMEKAKEFWANSGFPMEQLFVAPNTTSVINIDLTPDNKKDFLFVGTLYKGKGIELLLDSFKKLLYECKTEACLVIVGDGPEKDNIIKYVRDNNLGSRVIIKGAIYDELKLAQVFKTAIACISPTQGGLSVPKSMGYGVPFVVRRDAITGGEIFHIKNGNNGILYEKDDDLYYIMKEAMTSPNKYIEMGKNAKSYYDSYATPYLMARGAMDAIDYAVRKS